MTRKKLLFVVIALTVIFFVIYKKDFINNIIIGTNMHTFEKLNQNTRLLVIAPHCDDETLGSGNLIYETLHSDGKVKVVLMTNGDGHTSAVAMNYLTIRPNSKQYISSAYQRQQETLTAMSRVGLSDNDIIFLGYPDGGLYHMWGENWDETNPYTSRFTNHKSSPYSNSYTPHSLYCGKNVISDLEKVITDYQPTIIVYPHPNDHHPDHFSTYCFTKYILAKSNIEADQFLYLVHRGEWPSPFGHFPSLFIAPPHSLIDKDGIWQSLHLNKDEENLKTQMINDYKSQMRVMSLFLEAFMRRNELFSRYPDIELSRTSANDNSGVKATKIISDPALSRVHDGNRKSADIRNVYIFLNTTNLDIQIETASPPQNDITYHIDINFFSDTQKAFRANINISDNKNINLSSDTSENLNEISGLSLIPDFKMIHVQIPLSSIPAFNSFLINTSTSANSNGIDRTTWQLVKIK